MKKNLIYRKKCSAVCSLQSAVCSLRSAVCSLRFHPTVTKKELKLFGIASDDKCSMCNETDSIEHTFLECRNFLELLDASLQWFGTRHDTTLFISPYEALLNQILAYPLLTSYLKKQLPLLLQVKYTFIPAKL